MKNGRKKLIVGINDFESWCVSNGKKELLKEWDYLKNSPLCPNQVAYGSSKKVWWIATKCGHSFLASLNKRTSDNTGCPYCTGSHAKLLVGFNDLATTNPELSQEWDYIKNGDLKPNMVMKGQHKKVWWKGKCGHSWLATIDQRNRGRGCPICDNESKTSFPEQSIFFYLKQSFNDVLNRDRKTIRGTELDIYIPSIKTAIEYDGGAWHRSLEKDMHKNIVCKDNGVMLIRLRERLCPKMESTPFIKVIDVLSDKDCDLEKAIKELANCLSVEINVNISRDRSLILSQYIKSRKENSLLSLYPDIAAEWDYEKNLGLTPDMVIPTSPKKVWWIGKCGHSWNTSIHTRVGKNTGCPYCNSGRLLVGFNDLKTLKPEALKYWNYKKNTNCKPDDFTVGSGSKVWWHCDKCDNDFEMPISIKIKSPNACPYCSHKRVHVGVSDLLHVNPELAKEWDFEKNGDLTPDKVTFSSDKKVWWICSKGHSYKASICNRHNGRGCPVCSSRVIIKGVNDFATMHPELLEEWDYEKNEKQPSEYSEHSRVMVWWKDVKGHSWKQTIEHRSYGHGCPICNGTAKKHVLNIDTGQIFDSLSEAAKSCGLLQGDTISLCCQGKQKTAGGYHWKYVD